MSPSSIPVATGDSLVITEINNAAFRNSICVTRMFAGVKSPHAEINR